MKPQQTVYLHVAFSWLDDSPTNCVNEIDGNKPRLSC